MVPVVIAEPSSETCRRVWNDADRLVTSRLTFVEVAAALAMAERRGRLSADEHDEAWAAFTEIWPDVDIVELTPALTDRAAAVARSSALRGHDSVHCASATLLDDAALVAATGDADLLRAWRELGLAVLDINGTRGSR